MFLKFQALAILDGNGQGIIAAGIQAWLDLVQHSASQVARTEVSACLTTRVAQKDALQHALKENIMTNSQEVA